MKAVIMAGGEGKRLRPITCTMPKPMVPVLNKPIVDYTMELLRRHGIDEAVYTLHYMADVIKEHVGDGSAWGLRCSFTEEKIPLGTAGSVRQAICESDDEVLVMSGDGITDIDLTEVIRAHKSSGAHATIVLKKVSSPTEYGVALLDEDGMITRFIEKPEQSEVFSDLANTGIYILDRGAYDLIPIGVEYDFSKQLFPRMLAQGMKLNGYIADGYWCDVGDISEYRRAQYDMLDGKLSFSTIARKQSGIFIEPNAEVSEHAVLIPPCYIGSGASIGDGAAIESYSVIGSGVSIEGGSSVKRSIVFDNAKIRRNAQLRASVVCERAHIDENASVYEGSTVGAGSHIGVGVTVMPGVSIWPDKELEGGMSCRDNIVWGSSAARLEINGSRAEGYMDSSLTPETALRLAASYASGFSAKARLAVCCDGSQSAVVLKYAAIAGIASQGVNISSVKAVSKAAFSLTINLLGADGGLYIESGTDQLGSITVYDRFGIEASRGTLRSLRSAFLLGEHKPKTGVGLGIVSHTDGMEEMFENRLYQMLDTKAMEAYTGTLRINTDELKLRSIIKLLLRLGWKVEALRPNSKLVVPRDRKTLAVSEDRNGRLSLAYSAGGNTILDESAILTVLAVDAIENAGMKQIVLPVTLAEEYRKHLESYGAELSLASEDRSKLRRTAYEQGLYYAPLYESEAMILKLAELFSKGELEKLVSSMPSVYSEERRVAASKNEIGRLLRTLADMERGNERELVDGLRVKLDSGWVIVKPSLGRTSSFKILAGSSSGEYAKELCDLYVDKLKSLQREDKNS